MKKYIYIIYILIIIVLFSFILFKNKTVKKENHKVTFYIEKYKERYDSYRKKNMKLSDEEIILNVNIGLDRPFYSNTRESSDLKELTIVNKYNYLKRDYIPKKLISIDNTMVIDYVGKAFNQMKEEMKNNNLNIIAISGYRSYNYQDNLYKKYERFDGKEKADTYSARAGHSEHQTGLAVDISNGKLPYTDFEKTEEFKWMLENAYKYGFILRYPKNKEHITGYIFEAWHYRYVGYKVSTYIKKHNITFEEYYAKFIEPNLNR